MAGTVGSGDQWISWIHQNDLNRLIIAAIEQEAYRGTYMVTAPEPVTNREFARTLGRLLRRPAVIPLPAFPLRLVYGQLADELLAEVAAGPAVDDHGRTFHGCSGASLSETTGMQRLRQRLCRSERRP